MRLYADILTSGLMLPSAMVVNPTAVDVDGSGSDGSDGSNAFAAAAAAVVALIALLETNEHISSSVVGVELSLRADERDDERANVEALPAVPAPDLCLRTLLYASFTQAGPTWCRCTHRTTQ